MKNLLRFTLLLSFSFVHLAHSQVTKLSNNTDLNGFVLNNNTVILVSDADQTLWTTNGTTAGTVQYTNKVTQEKDGGGGVLGGKVYFAGVDASNGSELWVTDGTDAGTSLIKDIKPGADSSSPNYFFTYNNQLFFFAGTAETGVELWKTDGTAAGTVLVKDINPGSGDGSENSAISFLSNGIAYFIANDGTHGNELWKTDGTGGGTQMVKDINPGSGDGVGFRVQEQYYGINEFIALGSLTLFPANDGSGIELWKTDGTTQGTELVKDIESRLPGIGGSPSNLTAFNNKIYFSAITLAEGAELWVTDGTTAGTNLVKDIYPGNESSTPSLITSIIFGNRLVFTATDAAHGTELWSTDGTGEGTTLLKDINPGKDGSDAAIFVDFRNANGLNFSGVHTPPFNGKAYLSAGTEAQGSELWMTDGTAAGTVLIKDVYAGKESGVGNLNYFYTQNTLFFQGENKAAGSELWKSDGTAEGTVLVQDINPGTGSSDPDFNFAFNNHLYITANDGDNNDNTPDLYIVDESVTLPISLFNFAATVQQSKAVKLDWSTTNEINSSHFAIERSADGVQFNDIDKVNAAGNSSLQQQYRYIDPQPAHLNNPILYYRLKMVDKDGSFKYSRVLAVRFKESSFRFTFSPNPVQNQLSIVVSAGSSKSVALRITDISGKQVYQQSLSSSQNIAQQNVNVAGWQKGIYVIQLITDRSIKTARFVKQ